MKGEKKRRGRGRRRREEEEGDQAKVWNYGYEYGFYDFWYGIVWIFGFCMKLCVFGPC